jgi:ribosomal protein L3
MGTDNLTVRNIKIALVDVERNLLGVHGGVPGGVGAIVIIKPSR